LALNLSDQPRVGVPRVDQVDIVGDHALLDVGVEFGKEAQRELIPREYSDIDIAMPARLTSGTGTEQPYRGLISRPAYECSDAWRAMSIMQGTFAIFAVLPQIISHRSPLYSAEILGRRRFHEQKNSKNVRCSFAVFRCFEVQSHHEGATAGNRSQTGHL
jgi:hypothetical protein